VKDRGVRKQRVSEKHVCVHLKNNYFDEGIGNVLKHRVNTVTALIIIRFTGELKSDYMLVN